jgi:hypothetical protein
MVASSLAEASSGRPSSPAPKATEFTEALCPYSGAATGSPVSGSPTTTVPS